MLPMLCLCDYQEAAVSAQRPGGGGIMGFVFPHNVLFVLGNVHFIIQKIKDLFHLHVVLLTDELPWCPWDLERAGEQ